MPLYEELVASGNTLFRHRSYIPLILYVFASAAIFLIPRDLVINDALWWQLLCLMISLSGLVVRILTIGHTPRGTSGRNTKEGQVAEMLNTTGMYSMVRHPLYLGNFLMWLGLIVYVGSLWFFILAVLFFWLYYERIMLAEEAFLRKKFGDGYSEWASRLPAFIPRRMRWIRPGLRFSWKNILKREYSGLFAVFLSFALVDLMSNYEARQEFRVGALWYWGLLVTALIFLVLRTIKKQTRWLEVEGR